MATAEVLGARHIIEVRPAGHATWKWSSLMHDTAAWLSQALLMALELDMMLMVMKSMHVHTPSLPLALIVNSTLTCLGEKAERREEGAAWHSSLKGE